MWSSRSSGLVPSAKEGRPGQPERYVTGLCTRGSVAEILDSEDVGGNGGGRIGVGS